MKVIVVPEGYKLDGLGDVTEGVKAMYDMLVEYMNVGSGFLAIEEALRITELAGVLGFLDSQGMIDQVNAYLKFHPERCDKHFAEAEVAARAVYEAERDARMHGKVAEGPIPVGTPETREMYRRARTVTAVVRQEGKWRVGFACGCTYDASEM